MAELLTLARPYAKAVFNLAQENKDFDAWSDKLALLSLVSENPDITELCGNPKVTTDEIVSVYQDVGGNIVDELAANLLRLLAHNSRLGLLPEIFALYEGLKVEHLRSINVELTSAVTLSEKQVVSFTDKLKARFSREVNLTCLVDPSLVGGAIIRAGDKVIDGSVRGKLYQMAEELGA